MGCHPFVHKWTLRRLSTLSFITTEEYSLSDIPSLSTVFLPFLPLSPITTFNGALGFYYNNRSLGFYMDVCKYWEECVFQPAFCVYSSFGFVMFTLILWLCFDCIAPAWDFAFLIVLFSRALSMKGRHVEIAFCLGNVKALLLSYLRKSITVALLALTRTTHVEIWEKTSFCRSPLAQSFLRLLFSYSRPFLPKLAGLRWDF